MSSQVALRGLRDFAPGPCRRVCGPDSLLGQIEALAKEQAGVSRRTIVECAELNKTELLIKAHRLKTECIDMGPVAAAGARLLLRRCHQGRANTAISQAFRHEQHLDVQP